MNRSSLVSIIISNYNYGCFLSDAINSALAQTYPHAEVIVVDDGSTDHSAEVIQQYGNCIIPILKNNGGQASAFNAGFAKSRGDVIIFLDSDDTLFPSTAKQVMQCFATNHNLAKVHWPLSKMNKEGEALGTLLPAHALADGDFYDELVKNGPNHIGGPANSPPTSGNAWSRSYLEAVFPLPQPPFKNGSMDFFLSALAPLFGKVRSLTQPQGCYRIHGANDTLKPLDDYLKQFFCWYEITCSVLSQKLAEKNIHIKPETWPRNSWFHEAQAAVQELAEVVPEQAAYILADNNCLGQSECLKARKRIPFTEKKGQYNGDPENSRAAIWEIEKQRQKKVGFLAFAWPGFWLLDYYVEMKEYIYNRFPCLLKNERLIVFDLQPGQMNR